MSQPEVKGEVVEFIRESHEQSQINEINTFINKVDAYLTALTISLNESNRIFNELELRVRALENFLHVR